MVIIVVILFMVNFCVFFFFKIFCIDFDYGYVVVSYVGKFIFG